MLEHNNTLKWHPGVATCRDIGQWHRVRSMFLFCSAAPMLIGMLESRRPHAAHGANLVHQQKPFCAVCIRRQRGVFVPGRGRLPLNRLSPMRSPGSAGLPSTQVGVNWEALGGRLRQSQGHTAAHSFNSRRPPLDSSVVVVWQLL